MKSFLRYEEIHMNINETKINMDIESESNLKNPLIELGGINTLLAAAMPLLLLQIKLKNSRIQTSPVDLRRKVINEVAAFEARAKGCGCSPRMILAARYCICTALDEVVLLTEWGSNSVWAQQSLLSLIHKETWGGERFFIILEKMSDKPKQNILLLELLYVILSLGFEGKYYNQEKMVRDEIKHRLFRLIMMHHEDSSKALSPSKKTIIQQSLEIKPKIAKWKIMAGAFVVLFAFGFVFNIVTYFQARATLQQLSDIAQLANKISSPISEPTKPLVKKPKKHKPTQQSYNYSPISPNFRNINYEAI